MKMVKFHDRDETIVNMDRVNYITTRRTYYFEDWVNVIDIRFDTIEYSLIYHKDNTEDYEKDLDFLNSLLYK